MAAIPRVARVRQIYKENGSKESLEDMLVFGYACKLFRDDSKATEVDEGRHLIPWMNDNNILIDRFDGRGYLHDLKNYDADNADTREVQLSEEEKQIEALCEEERYLELHTDIYEKVTREEEEIKRLNVELSENPYQAVGFNYEQNDSQSGYDLDEEDEEEEQYTVPQGLTLPPNITTPDNMKSHMVIEKTARFVAQHGGQMEIMIKTKQHNNPQFQFMNFEDDINPYYKHLIEAIKSGKYKPQSPKKKEKRKSINDEDDDDEADGSGYLHPSLFSSNKTQLKEQSVVANIVTQLPGNQITGTSYAKLLTKMSKHMEAGRNSPNTTLPVPKQIPPSVPLPSPYLQSPSTGYHPQDTMPALPPPPMPHFLQHGTLDSSYHPNLPPPPGMEPVQLPGQPVDVSISQPLPPGTEQKPIPPYSQQTTYPAGIVPPPPDVQPIIDKMAVYVVKNGSEFESTVRAKSDPRFEFLNSWHVHYPYYDYKKTMYIKETNEDNIEHSEDKGTPKEISFSIKKKDEEPTVLSKKTAAGAFEDSDEEGNKKENILLDKTDQCQEERSVLDIKLERTQLSSLELDKKQAEEKLKNRLAAAAKERLVSAGREKQLQAERKRKAAMFITMLKGGADVTSMKQEDVSVSTPVKLPQVATKSTPSGSRHSSPSTCKRSPSRSKSPSKSRRSKSRSPKRRKKSRSPSRHSKTRSRSTREVKRSKRSRSRDRHKTKRSRSRSISKRRKSPPTSRKRSRSRTRRTKIKRRSRSPRKKSPTSRHRSSSSSSSSSPSPVKVKISPSHSPSSSKQVALPAVPQAMLPSHDTPIEDSYVQSIDSIIVSSDSHMAEKDCIEQHQTQQQGTDITESKDG